MTKHISKVIEEEKIPGTPSANELADRAKEHRKHQKGYPFLVKDAGDVEYNISMFNRMMGTKHINMFSDGSTSSECGDAESVSSSGEGAGTSESLDDVFKYLDALND